MELRPVDIKTLTPEVFRVFQTRNALLTAGAGDRLNTMTIGWCQLGTLWNLPVCTVYVRPERYTYGFMEENDCFTVSVLPEDRKGVLTCCGSKSGRDVDKIAHCGLTVARGAGDAPYFKEAELALVCKKLYVQDLDPACVKDDRVFASYTPQKGGWHRCYVGEVLEAYAR